jgi:hypothetical protein
LSAQKECTEEVIRTVATAREEFTENKDKPSQHAGNALGKMGECRNTGGLSQGFEAFWIVLVQAMYTMWGVCASLIRTGPVNRQ